MAYYEAIMPTAYRSESDVAIAVAEAVWNLMPVMDQGPPFDVNVYGDDGEQQIGVGVVFETSYSPESVEDCGAETVERVHVEEAVPA